MSVSKLWHYRIVDWSVAMMTREQHLSGRPRNNPNRHFQIVQKRRLVLPWRISFSVGSFLVEKLKCLTMLQKPFQSCSNWRKDCITFDLQKAAPLSNPAELHIRLSFSRSKRKKEQNKPWTPRKTEEEKTRLGHRGDEGETAFSFSGFLSWNDEQKIALPNVMRHHTFTSTEAKPNGSHWLNAFESKWDDFLVSGAVVWHIIDRKGG